MKCVVDHIGIAVVSLADATAFYRDVLGFDVEMPEDVPSQRVRAHVVHLDEPDTGRPRGVALELLEATADDSPIAKFVARRGPGIHHIALRVPDIVAALGHLKARGVRLIDETPRTGAHGSLVAFVHPSSTHGVLVELTQAEG
jgi:methylmalonyl-CoA/ethylmalonyl-CoA epimerase